MSESISSYRQIMKATSLFGGVQVFTIIITILKTKFIALWLGAAGVGFFSMFNNPLNLIISLAGLGLSISAIRDIAEANGEKDETKIASIIITFRRWVWFTGILGVIITVLLSSFLSYWSFGNLDYIFAFIALSVTILFSEINNGQKALLQGLRKYKEMALSTVVGALFGLLFSVPFYYFYRIDGIVPSIIVTSFFSLISSWYYSRQIKLKPISLNLRSTYLNGIGMIRLGVVLTLSGIIGMIIRYLISIYISNHGGIEQVGLYQTGVTLVSAYIGIVFTAMSTDYFPRLAGIKDTKERAIAVNQQLEITLLLVTPICIALMIALPLVINVLYTSAFLSAMPMLEWILLAVVFKSLAWCIGFIFLANKDFKLAFLIDNLCNVVLLFGYIGMYRLLGLNGVGIAEVGLYILATLLSFYFGYKKYNFIFSRNSIRIIIISLIVTLTVFLVLRINSRSVISYIISTILFLGISAFSFISLSKKLDLQSIFNKKVK